MRIKKGHLTGFFSTIIIFAIVFFYIYNGTKENTWIYNLDNKTKTKIGKNITKVEYSLNEKYVSYTTYNGTLKVCKITELKNPIITKKDINFHKFVNLNNNPNLVFIDKEGETYLYNFKETKKLDINCFNDYIYIYNNKILSIAPKLIKIYDLNTNKQLNKKIDLNFETQDELYVNNKNLCVFHENKLCIFNLENFSKKEIEINDYAQKGIYENNNVIYINSNGETVLNSNIIKGIKPYNILYKDSKVYFATRHKTKCYDTYGKEIWSKDIMSNYFVINNKGNILASVYKNLCAFYDINSQEEQFTIEAKKVEFSPSDKNITVTEKSQF